MRECEFCVKVSQGRVVEIRKTIRTNGINGNSQISGTVAVLRLQFGTFAFEHAYPGNRIFNAGQMNDALSNFRPEVAEIYKQVFSLENPTVVDIMKAGLGDCEVEYLDP
jgi:hypothetical protein